MKHKRTQLLLAVYDDLTPEEQEEINTHLAGCEECRRKLNIYRAIDSRIQAAPPPELPSGFRQEFIQRRQLEAAANRGLLPKLQLASVVNQGIWLFLLVAVAAGLGWIVSNLPAAQPASGPPANPTVPPSPIPRATPTQSPSATPAPVWSSANEGVLETNLSEILLLAISGDGEAAAVADGGNRIEYWLLEPGVRQRYWSIPTFQTAALALSPDKQWIAAGSSDYSGYVMLYAADGSREFRLDDPAAAISSLRFSEDRSLLSVGTGGADPAIRLYRLPDGELTGEVPWTGAALIMQAFSPNGGFLAAADSAGEVRLIQTSNGQRLSGTILPAGGWVGALAWSPDGERLAVGSNDRITLVRVLDGRTEENLVIRTEEPVADLLFSPDGRYLAGGTSAGRLQVWDLSSGTATTAFSEDYSRDIKAVSRLAFTDSHLAAVFAGLDGMLQFWHIHHD